MSMGVLSKDALLRQMKQLTECQMRYSKGQWCPLNLRYKGKSNMQRCVKCSIPRVNGVLCEFAFLGQVKRATVCQICCFLNVIGCCLSSCVVWVSRKGDGMSNVVSTYQ